MTAPKAALQPLHAGRAPSGTQWAGRPAPLASAAAPAETAASATPPAMTTWEKQVLSARGFKRVGRHSEYAI